MQWELEIMVNSHMAVATGEQKSQQISGHQEGDVVVVL